MTDVRTKDLAVVQLDGREVKGIVEEVREDHPGHTRVVVNEVGGDEVVDTGVDRVEVAR